VIHTENLLHPLQLLYFYLWPIYWHSLVEKRNCLIFGPLKIYVKMLMSSNPRSWGHIQFSQKSLSLFMCFPVGRIGSRLIFGHIQSSFSQQCLRERLSLLSSWHCCFVFWRPRVQISVMRLAILTVSFGFPQPLRSDAEILSQFRPWSSSSVAKHSKTT
jgi:hypothetical protein